MPAQLLMFVLVVLVAALLHSTPFAILRPSEQLALQHDCSSGLP